MKQKILFTITGFSIGIICAVIALAVFFDKKIPEKQSQNKPKNVSNVLSANSTAPKEIVGFFPYWNLDKVGTVDLSNLTTVYYFALDLNADGSWNRDDPGISRIKSSRYRLLKEEVKRNGARWGLTIINLSADSISRNINNLTRQDNIIKNTIAMMKQEDFIDLNIDLEYMGESNEALKQSFTQFVVKLTSAVKNQIPQSRITIDLTSDTYARPRIYDLSALSKTVDSIIVMGYDFHRLSSIKAGPVAPLFGKELFEYDISTTITNYLHYVPSDKLILGVPFYGYEWPTENDQKDSFVIHSSLSPQISSYERSLKTAEENHVAVNFDDLSKSVWFAYFDSVSHTWRQVWFENQRSLGLKFDLVNDLNLRGIGIFALGYDGASAKPLWDEIRLKLK